MDENFVNNFWEDKVASCTPKIRILRMSSKTNQYLNFTNSPNISETRSHLLGFGGHWWMVLNPDKETMCVSNNVWSAGDVPERFMERFPDEIKCAHSFSTQYGFQNIWWKNVMGGVDSHTRVPLKVVAQLIAFQQSRHEAYLRELAAQGRKPLIESPTPEEYWNEFRKKAGLISEV